MKNNIEDTWLIGTGLMGMEYAKVLQSLDVPFITIGRGEVNCNEFENKTGLKAITGGLVNFLRNKPSIPKQVIIAVGVEVLFEVTKDLLEFGIKKILLEKPGVAYPREIDDIVTISEAKEAVVMLAYNRRFYASVQTARKLIEEDGGITSFTFEFTEWSHVIKDLPKHNVEHQNWFLGNSTHVVDTAFYLGGKPLDMQEYATGSLEWHPKSSIFAGAGTTEKGALFSYHANWEAPGRWGIELLTKKNRYILRPMETLQVQKLGMISIEPVALDDRLDKDFKPGLFEQTKRFLQGDLYDFCDVLAQQRMMGTYSRMANYSYHG